MTVDDVTLRALVIERASNLGMAYAKGLLERGLTPNVKLAFGCACQAFEAYLLTDAGHGVLHRREAQGIFLTAFIEAITASVQQAKGDR